MNLILSYYKCKDDWTDERKKKGYIYVDTGAMYRALAVYFLDKN